jgi:hypothetical protein
LESPQCVVVEASTLASGTLQLDGRIVMLFAVAGVTPLSLSLVSEQLRRRGAAEVHGCGVAIDGAAATGGLDSFRALDAAEAQLLNAVA